MGSGNLIVWICLSVPFAAVPLYFVLTGVIDRLHQPKLTVVTMQTRFKQGPVRNDVRSVPIHKEEAGIEAHGVIDMEMIRNARAVKAKSVESTIAWKPLDKPIVGNYEDPRDVYFYIVGAVLVR